MKGTNALAAAAALTMGLAAPARAQQPVEPGDEIFVTGRNGAQSRGRVLRISPSALILVVDKQEQVIPSSGIGRIEKADSLWNGMLLGAAPFALLGGAASGASCSPTCGRDIPLGMLVFGAIGAGLGAVVDSRIRGYSVIDGPPLVPSNARRAPPPVTALDQLWLRVRAGDTITVVTRGGAKRSRARLSRSRAIP